MLCAFHGVHHALMHCNDLITSYSSIYSRKTDYSFNTGFSVSSRSFRFSFLHMFFFLFSFVSCVFISPFVRLMRFRFAFRSFHALFISRFLRSLLFQFAIISVLAFSVRIPFSYFAFSVGFSFRPCFLHFACLSCLASCFFHFVFILLVSFSFRFSCFKVILTLRTRCRMSYP